MTYSALFSTTSSAALPDFGATVDGDGDIGMRSTNDTSPQDQSNFSPPWSTLVPSDEAGLSPPQPGMTSVAAWSSNKNNNNKNNNRATYPMSSGMHGTMMGGHTPNITKVHHNNNNNAIMMGRVSYPSSVKKDSISEQRFLQQQQQQLQHQQHQQLQHQQLQHQQLQHQQLQHQQLQQQQLQQQQLQQQQLLLPTTELTAQPQWLQQPTPASAVGLLLKKDAAISSSIATNVAYASSTTNISDTDSNASSVPSRRSFSESGTGTGTGTGTKMTNINTNLSANANNTNANVPTRKKRRGSSDGTVTDIGEKKRLHNAAEKRRQQKISQQIEDLKATVQLASGKKIPRGRAHVLSATHTFLGTVLTNNEQMLLKQNQLMFENDALRQQLTQLSQLAQNGSIQQQQQQQQQQRHLGLAPGQLNVTTKENAVQDGTQMDVDTDETNRGGGHRVSNGGSSSSSSSSSSHSNMIGVTSAMAGSDTGRVNFA